MLCSERVRGPGHGGGGDVSSVAELRAEALEVAAGWAPPGAPASWQLTASLFRVIAEHEDLLGRLAGLPPGRLPTLLASAAISFLVRRDRPEPLAGYFPEPGSPQPRLDAGFYLAATSFISAHLEDIAAECGRHRYQMNEVARCTQVALGLAATAGPGTDPVALVDLGTGAGLGLQLDRYRYLVGGQAGGRPPPRWPSAARRAAGWSLPRPSCRRSPSGPGSTSPRSMWRTRPRGPGWRHAPRRRRAPWPGWPRRSR